MSISQGKGIFKDVARIFELDFKTSNEISKMIPDKAENLTDALLESKELQDKYDTDTNVKEIIDYAIRLEGCVKSIGVHACGVVLSDTPITDHVPLFESKGAPVTMFDGGTCEKIGLIKIDILGLKTLSVMEFANDLIKSRHGITLDFYNLPVDDGPAYDIIAKQDNLGIFQLEGSAISGFANKCRPRSINDLSLILAAYRPGPMSINGLLDRIAKKISGRIDSGNFAFPKYNHIFEISYNELIYQESFMRLSMEMCGFTDVEADLLRQATAKKDMKKLMSLKDLFIEGAVRGGEDREQVEQFWEYLLGFAAYSFNLSHSVSYAHLTYYTAYLKANYPVEFYTAIISCEEDTVQQAIYMDDARKNNINVLPPDVNQSLTDFSASVEGNILFGFSGIKGVGPAVYDQLINLRPYYSFGDFLIKCYTKGKRINKKVIDALINCGACDCFGFKRSCMLRSYEKFILDLDPTASKNLTDEAIKNHLKNQDAYFSDDNFPEYPLLTILELEKELLGIYVSGSPFKVVKNAVRDEYKSLESINAVVKAGGVYSGYVLCRLTEIRKITTKTGGQMAFLSITDHLDGNGSVTVFSSVLAEMQDIQAGKYYLLLVNGKLDSRGVSLIAHKARDLSAEIDNVSSRVNADKEIKHIDLITDGLPGTVRVKTILSMIGKMQSQEDLGFSLTVKIKVNKVLFNIKTFNIKPISISTIRELNTIPSVIVHHR